MIPYKQLIFGALKLAKRHLPTILSVAACGGVVATAYFSAKAAPYAKEEIWAAERSKAMNLGIADSYDAVKLSPIEKVKVCWKPFVPAFLSGTATIACVIGANYIHLHREALLTAAVGMAQTALKEYKDVTEEVVGEDSAKSINDKILDKHMLENSLNDIIDTGTGNTLFFEDQSKQWFWASEFHVTMAEYVLNRYFILRGSVNFKTFQRLLQIKESPWAEGLGWDQYIGKNVYGYEWIDFTHTKKTRPDGMEYIHISYPFDPIDVADLMDGYRDCGFEESNVTSISRF